MFGAVRGYTPHTNTLVIHIENAGDFGLPVEAVQRVHDVDVGRLDTLVREGTAYHGRVLQTTQRDRQLERSSARV
jgi:hypothetical protein